MSISSPDSPISLKSILIALALVLLLSATMAIFMPSSSDTTEVTIHIPQGSTLRTISKILKENKVIRFEEKFVLFTRLFKMDKKLHAGDYQLKRSYSLFQTVQALRGRYGQALIKVTIPEGQSLSQIANILLRNNLITDKTSFLTYLRTQAKSELKDQFQFLENIPTSNLEGYFYPETYFFAQSISQKSIAEAFLHQFQKNILPIWENAKPTESISIKTLSLHKTMAMASLIEKEAQIASEMPLISSVFHNRLKKRMRLASDPTVVFALGLDHKDIVYYKDLTIDSPYNTYKYWGLPPTPIGAPSAAAFTAALYPDKTTFLFFVANKKGGHEFSTTYQQHLYVQKKIKRNNR